ncbi:MAG: uridylate kinase [Parcubacteria group bacterium Gr01-1014_70]|nr:MAG: uridylate kinase [Parcubacteria group bacterium Gr01-1014_70]
MNYKRVVVKLTGESLAAKGEPISLDAITFVAKELEKIRALGADLCVVVGGGNIVRGAALSASGGVERVAADHMGMMATVINALALSSVLRQRGVETRVQTAIEIKTVAEPAIRDRAMRHLEKGRIVIFACGTGNPHFSTDTAAVLRASEVHADAIIKGTKVDGVYTDDPATNPDAKLIPDISYQDAFVRQLRFMDAAAIGFAMENYRKPIHVINVFKEDNLLRVVSGEKIGSVIH